MATVAETIALCASQIGQSGSKYNKWYWGADNGYAWCAAFQSWISAQLGGLGYNYSASCSGIFSQLPRVADANVQPGDYVFFNWDGRTATSWMDHIGIVEWFDHSSGYFGTIEGNTGSLSGGRVERVTRYNYGNYFTCFARPTYGSSAKTPKQPVTDAINLNGLFYSSHSANVGDNAAVHDGQVSGTVGFSSAIEGISIDSEHINLSGKLRISCSLHLAGIGQKNYGEMTYGKYAGTRSEKRPVEAIGLQILENTTGKKLYMRVHQAFHGWGVWQEVTKTMTFAGSTGQSGQVEAWQLYLK